MDWIGLIAGSVLGTGCGSGRDGHESDCPPSFPSLDVEVGKKPAPGLSLTVSHIQTLKHAVVENGRVEGAESSSPFPPPWDSDCLRKGVLPEDSVVDWLLRPFFFSGGGFFSLGGGGHSAPGLDAVLCMVWCFFGLAGLSTLLVGF